MNNVRIHETADVQSSKIGSGTTVWQSVVIFSGASIGTDVNICCHCLVENDVIIGDRVTVKSGVYLWDGIRLEDDVFIGPNVTFTNDKFPRSKVHTEALLKTTIEQGASVGGGAVILPGICIGRGAMVGAGSVVTKSVPPYAIVVGSPARITGYVENAKNGVVRNLSEPFVGAQQDSESVGVGGVSIHHLTRVQDIRGDLCVGEFEKAVPFMPKRYFLVYNVPSKETRGEHAHYTCKQFLICIRGSCSVVVDDGSARREILLDTPSKGVYLPPLIWGVEYKYTSDAILLVFASEYYDSDDYIRNYDEFIKLTVAAERS